MKTAYTHSPHCGRRPAALFLFLACLLLSVLLIPKAYAKEANLLQFTSKGHILGFSPGSMYMASGSHMLKVEFLGGKSVSPVSKEGPSSDGKAPPLSKVTYPNIWDGVDIVYEGAKGSIVKSTYTVAAGKAPGSIRLRYNRPLTLDEKGNLVVRYETGTITESKPIAWQVIEGKKKPVMVAYNLQSDKEVGFTVKDYDKSIPLVIDPSFGWYTFLGGSSSDYVGGIAMDSSGNFYVAGHSNATWGTPLRPYTGGWDVFVAKLTADGQLVWNTFLGGSGDDRGGGTLRGGGGFSRAGGIGLDSSGNIYVAGTSGATWGDSVRGYTGGSDAFVAKLTADGQLVWNTFLGGSGTDSGTAMAVDAGGNVYVVGDTDTGWGNPINLFAGLTDCSVAKVTSDGQLAWNTFFGSYLLDYGYGVALDRSGNVYVLGTSQGGGWGSPVRAYTGGADAFVAKMTPDGALTWHAFLGGSDWDHGYGIAADESGNIYTTGLSKKTWGSPVRAFSGVPGNSWDVFVAKMTSDGALTWNTFLGGATGCEEGWAVTSDPRNGKVYVTGQSNYTWGSPIRDYGGYYGDSDVFVAGLAADGELIWNTFLQSGSNSGPGGIALDSQRDIYIAGLTTGTKWGSPIRAYSGGYDGFLMKINRDKEISVTLTGTGTGTVTSSPAGIDCGSICSASFAEGTTVTLTAVAGAVGTTFYGWTGGGCSGTGTCVITMAGEDIAVSAEFSPTIYTVNASVSGGHGTVSPETQAVTHKSSVSITMTPDAGYHIVTITDNVQEEARGAKKGSGTRKVVKPVRSAKSGSGYVYSISSITANHTVAVAYEADLYTLTATKTGAGTGTLTATGLACSGNTCSGTYPYGASVTITATHDAGSSFTGWTGCDSTSGNTCVIAITANKSVAAAFGISDPCTYTVSWKDKPFAHKGGSATITVKATGAKTCTTPTPSASDAWITTSMGSFANNKGTVRVTISANDSVTERTGAVTIRGNSFQVTQDGTPCTLTISSTGNTLSPAGGTDSFTVNAPTGCAWSVSSSEDWLTGITSAGTGTGPVSYTASENTTGKQRIGKITVFLTDTPTKKKVFTVKQSLCTLTTSSTGNTLSPVGGTDSFTVNAPTGCAWSVSSSEDWLTGITSAGTGTGPVSYTASENTTGKQRSGKITVFLTDTPTKKKVFTVTEKK